MRRPHHESAAIQILRPGTRGLPFDPRSDVRQSVADGGKDYIREITATPTDRDNPATDASSERQIRRISSAGKVMIDALAEMRAMPATSCGAR